MRGSVRCPLHDGDGDALSGLFQEANVTVLGLAALRRSFGTALEVLEDLDSDTPPSAAVGGHAARDSGPGGACERECS